MKQSTAINTFNCKKLDDFVLKLEKKKTKHYIIPIQLYTRSCNRGTRQEKEVKVYMKKRKSLKKQNKVG